MAINAGVGTAWNLIWNNYEGFVPLTYNINRGTSLSNMLLLTSIAASACVLNSYTNLTAPTGNAFYQIEVVNTSLCNPSRKSITSYTSIKSNIVNTSDVGIKESSNINAISIYPNPFSSSFTIAISSSKNEIATVRISDLLGKLVYQTKAATNSNIECRLSKETNTALKSGVHFVTVQTATEYKTVRLLKE